MAGMTMLIMVDNPIRESLIGPQGIQGEQGIQGIQGIQGEPAPECDWHLIHTLRESEPWMYDVIWIDLPQMENTSITYTTETFEVQGKEIRIRWVAYANYFRSTTIINIMYDNGTQYTNRGSCGDFGSYACEMAIHEPGKYYLEVHCWCVHTLLVTVYDYY